MNFQNNHYHFKEGVEVEDFLKVLQNEIDKLPKDNQTNKQKIIGGITFHNGKPLWQYDTQKDSWKDFKK